MPALTFNRSPGSRRDPYLGLNFRVEIGDLEVGGFTEVTGLQVETEFQDYREGGVNEYVHRLPGPMRYPQNLVLKHGLTDGDSLWSWCQDVARGVITRLNVTIYLLDNAGLPVVRWEVQEAYPVRWSGPEFRAEHAGVAFESIELTHRGLVKSAA